MASATTWRTPATLPTWRGPTLRETRAKSFLSNQTAKTPSRVLKSAPGKIAALMNGSL